MDEGTKLVIATIMPTFAVLVGILVNNRQIDSLRNEMRSEIASLRNEINSLRAEMNARFAAAHEALLRVEGVLDARLKHLEENLR